MCGCVTAKGTTGSAKNWDDAEAKAKAQEAEAAARAEAGQAVTSADDLPPPQTAAEEADEFGREAPSPPMRLESLQEALAASLRVDANQLRILKRFWRAVGLDDDEFPKEPLQLSIDGDASALQLAIALSPSHFLGAIPTFLSLAPDARPSPPAPHGEAIQRPVRHLQPEMAFAAVPPHEGLKMAVEGPGRPERKLRPEVVLSMAPPQGLSSWLGDDLQPSKTPPVIASSAEPLPTLVSTGERPRGKAKAKSKVIRDSGTSGMSAPAPTVLPPAEVVSSPPQLAPPPAADYAQAPLQDEPKEFSPEPRSDTLAPSTEIAPASAAQVMPAKPQATISIDGSSAELDALQEKMQNQTEVAMPELIGKAAGSVAPASAQALTEKKKAVEQIQAPAPIEPKKAIRQIQVPTNNVQTNGQSSPSAALQWEEALSRAIEELASPQVVLWLQLGGLGLPKGVESLLMSACGCPLLPA